VYIRLRMRSDGFSCELERKKGKDEEVFDKGGGHEIGGILLGGGFRFQTGSMVNLSKYEL
jgi:hypothetical protein